MNPNAIHQHLARLQRECDVSAVPALLLFAACALFVLVLAISAVPGETAPAQAVTPTPQFEPAPLEPSRRNP